MNPPLNAANLIRRLRDQACAGGHRWTDIMRLLLEAADALENAAPQVSDGASAGAGSTALTGDQPAAAAPWEECLSKSRHCRKNNPAVRECCSLGGTNLVAPWVEIKRVRDACYKAGISCDAVLWLAENALACKVMGCPHLLPRKVRIDALLSNKP